MLRAFIKSRLTRALLGEIGRARKRIAALRAKFPTAGNDELAQHLIHNKKTWAATGGAVSGLFGLITLPADLAYLTYLQLSLIVDIAVLQGVNLKSDRARDELLDVLAFANGVGPSALRSGPKLVSRIAEAVLVKRWPTLGRAVPVIAAPLSAALNNRDIEKAGEEALRAYGTIPRALNGRAAPPLR